MKAKASPELIRALKTLLGEQNTMKSGLHQHRCPACTKIKYCSIITHCKRPWEYACDNCAESEAKKAKKAQKGKSAGERS